MYVQTPTTCIRIALRHHFIITSRNPTCFNPYTVILREYNDTFQQHGSTKVTSCFNINKFTPQMIRFTCFTQTKLLHSLGMSFLGNFLSVYIFGLSGINKLYLVHI